MNLSNSKYVCIHYFLRELVDKKRVTVGHVRSDEHHGDILTKALHLGAFFGYWRVSEDAFFASEWKKSTVGNFEGSGRQCSASHSEIESFIERIFIFRFSVEQQRKEK